jgi:hypothetical protein
MNRWSMLLAAFLLWLAPAAGAREAGRRGDDAAAHVRQARELRTRSRQLNDAAVSEYRAALKRETGNLEAERGLARALRDRGAEAEALPYLREVAERSGEGVDHARLAWSLFRAGRWAEAADAFARARQRGMNDSETLRGDALAATAARAALGPRAASPDAADGATPPKAPPDGWRRAWGTLLNATGLIADAVQRLLFWGIALLIVGGLAARVRGTLMGERPVRQEEGTPLRQWLGLGVHDLATGRRLGRVQQVVYDPKLARVVGFRVGGRWRWQVLPLPSVQGMGPAGLLVADARALLPGDQAGELGTLARAGAMPLGTGSGLKRVVTEEGRLIAYTRAHRLWIDGASVSFEVSPSRFHDAWRVGLSALQLGPVDWLLGRLLDSGLELLPGRISARLRLPAHLVRSADREVVIVSGEAEAWIEEHFLRLEAEAQARLAQVREGVDRARPVLEAGVARARPLLARARDSGLALARRSAEGVLGGVWKGGASGNGEAGGEEANGPPGDPA